MLMPAVRFRASARILPLLKWSWYGPAVASQKRCQRGQEAKAGGSCKKRDGLMILLLLVLMMILLLLVLVVVVVGGC